MRDGRLERRTERNAWIEWLWDACVVSVLAGKSLRFAQGDKSPILTVFIVRTIMRVIEENGH